MGYKQSCYTSNGRFHKSDEIAEEEKVSERKDSFSFKKSILIIKNIYMNKNISHQTL